MPWSRLASGRRPYGRARRWRSTPAPPCIVGAGQYLHRAGDRRRRARAGRADGRGGAGRHRRRRARRRAGGVDSIARRQRAVVALRQPGVGARRSPRHRAPASSPYTTVGGNTPQSLVNRTALDIAAGRTDLAILAGGEAWRTRMRARNGNGIRLDWAKAPDAAADDDRRRARHDAPGRGRQRASTSRCRCIRCSRSAIRAAAGTPPDEHLADDRRAVVALQRRRRRQPVTRGSATPESPRRSSHVTPRQPDHRLPVPQGDELQQRRRHGGGADHVLGARRPRALGIATRPLGLPPRRHRLPRAQPSCRTAGTFADTPAIRIGGRRALELAGIGIDDVALVDLYSCFPSAVQLGAASLGLDLDASSPAPAAWRSPADRGTTTSMHAIATDRRRAPRAARRAGARLGQRRLRSRSTRSASTAPCRPPTGFRHERPQRRDRRPAARELADRRRAQPAPATIEAYTVMFERDGDAASRRSPRACSRRPAGLGDVGRRRRDATAMTEGEWVGRRVRIDADRRLCMSDSTPAAAERGRASSSTATPATTTPSPSSSPRTAASSPASRRSPATLRSTARRTTRS